MQSRITIILDGPEKNALQKLSRYEYREIHKQAAVIIRDELTRRGLLPITPASLSTKIERNLYQEQTTTL